MKLYVLTAEPYHDNSTVIGVFKTRKAAQMAIPGLEWETDGDRSLARAPDEHPLRCELYAEQFEIRLVVLGTVMFS